MKSLVLVAVLAVSVNARAEPAETASRGRGWLTGLGVGLAGAGLAALAVGGAFSANAAESDALLKAYNPPTAEQANSAKRLLDQRDGALSGALVMWVAGGVLIAAGIASVLFDGLAKPTLGHMAWAPLVGPSGALAGATLTYTAGF